MPVVIDKMPLNFRWLGFILEAIPEARVVNLVRDPIAVCWSIFKTTSRPPGWDSLTTWPIWPPITGCTRT